MSPEVIPFYEPESCTWTYLLSEHDGKEAAIIDPVWVFDPVSGLADTGFTDLVLATATDSGRAITWVLETHAHADHLSSAAYIREQTGARVAIGQGICAVQETFARVFNLDDVTPDGSQFDRLLSEGDTLAVGGLEIRVMETPGHTSDSVTYLVADAAFVGDTLFAPGYGTARCDFPGGDAGRLYDSITRLHALPDATRLFLCHDYPAEGQEPLNMVTVADSRAHNVHLQEGVDREAYVAMRTGRDAGLALPRLIYPSLQVNIRGGAAPPPDRNGAAYLRLPFDRPLKSLLESD